MTAPKIVSFGTVTLDIYSGPPGTPVTAHNTGTGFFGTMTVTVDGVSAADITVLDHQTMTFLSPAADGDVVITNPDDETVTLANQWANVVENSAFNHTVGISVGVFV
jgi:hypothetical protein